MAKEEKTFEELVRTTDRGEPRLPEMQRRYVRLSTRVQDIFHSLCGNHSSGTGSLREVDEKVPLRDKATHFLDYCNSADAFLTADCWCLGEAV